MSLGTTLEPPPGMSYADFVRTWNDEQIAAWLTKLGCAHQVSTFKDNDIQGNVILDLDQHALKEMEVTSIGDRIKILNAVKFLRQQCTKNVGATPRVLVNGGSASRVGSQYDTSNGLQQGTPQRHQTASSDGRSDESVQAGRRSSGGRRLDGGRPPPLNITQSATRDLPQLSANSTTIATSPAPSVGAVTPRPGNQQQSQAQNAQVASRDQGRTQSVTTPLTATSIASLPKYAPPTRSYGASLPVGHGRRTPTQGESFTPSAQSFPPPPYTNEPLPPAPGSSSNSPPTAHGQWQGEYGLPRGPKNGNLTANAYETASEAAARRAGSPLPPIPPVRSSTAKMPISNADRSQTGHQKSGSVGLIGQENRSNLGKGAAVQAALGRPSTAASSIGGSSQQALHPYAAAASSSSSSGAPSIPFPTGSSNTLQVNSTSRGGRDLSPINEAHSLSETTPTSGTYSFTSGSGSNSGFAVKRGPFPRNPAPSYDELQRLLIRFYLHENGQPTTAVNSSVVNVATCEGGVEIIERALKKFNKSSVGRAGLDADDDRTGETESGGLIVDGWGLFPGGPQNEATGGPLSESQILAICHADPKHPTREQGLTLRNVRKVHSRKLANFFGETPPGPGIQTSPTSPTYTVGPKLQSGQDEDGILLTPSSLKFPTSATQGTGNRRMDRASTISIMSGLGADHILNQPLSPGGTPSIRSPSSNSFLSGGHKKLRNFFGQRPPSELITSHLPEFFPSTSKKVLQRTARNSMLRAHSSKRDSRLSAMGAPSVRMSFQAPSKSRFSSSSAGSNLLPYATRNSSSPPRSSMGSAPSIKDNASITGIREGVAPPRMSVETDDGQSIDISTDDGATTDDTESTKKSLDHTLPPLPILGASLEDSLTTAGLSVDWLSRSESNTAKRMSYHSMRGRDKSDTASLLTLDEITAEVESRRQSMLSVYEDDDTDEDGNVVVRRPNKRVSIAPSMQDDGDEGEDEEEYDDEEEEDYDDDDEEEDEEDEDEDEEEEEAESPTAAANGEPGKAVTSSGGKRSIKWIKGALIGSGSFGSVYLGMDAMRGLLMAVKQVELPTGSSQNEERKKSMLTALEREIELLKQLQHENIVQYLDSSMDAHHLNIFLEYVPGGSVATLLRNYGAFEEPLVRNWVGQILQGLNYLHEREIIHRDIKGGNILVDNKGGIKISDFGISKKVEDNLLGGARLHRPSLQGSVFWMAPEVVKQTSYTYKADIWSVGCLVVEMLTGQHPWAQLTQMQAIFKIGSSAKPTIPPDITQEADTFLNKTFELDYTIRPTAAQLLEDPWISEAAAQGFAGNATVSAAANASSVTISAAS